MSVADIKASRRKFRALQRKGWAPRPHGLTIAQSIERNRKIAVNMAKSKS